MARARRLVPCGLIPIMQEETTTSWASGTNKTSLCPLWEKMASVGGDCALTLLLELTTEQSGHPFCLWDGKNTPKYSCGANEKPSHPLRWDLTRGRGDEAQRVTHSWHDSGNPDGDREAYEGSDLGENLRSDAWSCRGCGGERIEDERYAMSACVSKGSPAEKKKQIAESGELPAAPKCEANGRLCQRV